MSRKSRTSERNSTRRSVLRKTGALGTVAASGIVAGCLGAGGGSDDNEYTFGAGPSDSMSFAMANQFSHNIDSNSDHSVNLTSQPSSQALALLLSGENELAWSSTFIGQQAADGSGSFEDVTMNYTPMQIMSYYYMRVGLVSKTSSDIEYYGDLGGENFAPGPAGASFYPPLEMAMHEILPEEDVSPRHMAVSELPQALAENRAIAVGGPMKMNGIIPSYMSQAYSQNDSRLLAWSEEALQAIEDHPMLTTATESNDELGGINEFTSDSETEILSVNFVVYGSEQMTEDLVYDMLETLWENRDGLEEGHAAFAPFQEDSFWTENFTTELPVHPGAADFCRDKGIWNEEFEVGEL